MQPLALDLYKLLPVRAASPGSGSVTFGFGLRLAGEGPVVEDTDPLLRAFGASVVEIEGAHEHDEALQPEAFDPGRRVHLMTDGVDSDGDPVVAVWDATGTNRGGFLPFYTAVAVAGAIEQGLCVEGLVLDEERAFRDDRRMSLRLLVHAPAFVRVDTSEAEDFRRPERPRRRRIVLFADGSGAPRWWDPTLGDGPAELTDVPVSSDLAEELDRLKQEFAELQEAGKPESFFDDMEAGWARRSLSDRTRMLWCRARAELGRTHAVGLLGPGMERPIWTPEEVAADDPADDDIPF